MQIADIYRPIQGDLLRVEEGLRSLVSEDFHWMMGLLDHVLKDAGKRMRPALTLLSGKSYSYDLGLLLPMATAVELLHTATLVHDDTVDGSQVRRGRPTVNSLWGEASSVLLGDYLFARSADLVSTTGNVRVMQLFARTLMAISSGELKQVFTAYHWQQTREEYYQKIGSKTASLFAMATESGAVLSQAPEEAMQALKSYGHSLGLAFQIVDDVLDFIGDEGEMGKPVGSDLLQGTLTLPAILLLERHPEDNPVKAVFQSRGDQRELQRAVNMVRNSDIVQECYDIALDLCSQARRSLEELPDNASRRSLAQVLDYCLERRR